MLFTPSYQTVPKSDHHDAGQQMDFQILPGRQPMPSAEEEKAQQSTGHHLTDSQKQKWGNVHYPHPHGKVGGSPDNAHGRQGQIGPPLFFHQYRCSVIGKGKDSTWYRYIGTAVFVDRKSTRLNSSHVKISYAVF